MNIENYQISSNSIIIISNNQKLLYLPEQFLDDSKEATNFRLQMFKENTLPMLKYFDDKGKLKVVCMS